MTKEEIDYIILYFSDLLDRRQAIALSHHFNLPEFETALDKGELRRKWFLERGIITQDPEILKLLHNGSEQLRLKAAEDILKNNPDKVFFNRCKLCGKLARTHLAKQCRFCGYDWH